jgi:hypothetical protein
MWELLIVFVGGKLAGLWALCTACVSLHFQLSNQLTNVNKISYEHFDSVFSLSTTFYNRLLKER